jgi:NAD(P)-dependent dehydrogenase (short-subunit alcohol dehydrogenase family)
MKGKTIVITGVSSGIGAATAVRMATRGANIIGMDIVPPAIETGQFIKIDLSDPLSIEETASRLPAGIDGLCNIAGVPPTKGREKILQINFMGLRLLTDSLIPKMNVGASIVNIGSLAGVDWERRVDRIREFLEINDFLQAKTFCDKYDIADEDSYAFSKEVLIVWTIMNAPSLLSRQIRMNNIHPGPVETPILHDFRETIGDRFKEQAAFLGKAATSTANIAAVVSFLCSDESSWIKGANIPVDGGMMAALLKSRL